MQWLEALNTMSLPPLIQGSHPSGPEYGMCAMEMIAFMERQPQTDSPKGVCHVLRQFTIAVNDLLPDAERQKLKPVLPMLVDTERANDIAMERQRVIDGMTRRIIEDHMHDLERHYGPGHRRYYHEGGQYRELRHLLDQGPQGCAKAICVLHRPHIAAPLMIDILKEACAIMPKEQKRTEFTQPERVKKLAKVVYLPEAKRGKQVVMSNEQAKMIMHLPHQLIDPKKAAGVVCFDYEKDQMVV